jgi:ribonuclease HI
MFPVFLYTDGSCLGNPGPGGYAAILQGNGRQRELVGSDAHTTNNRMELMAVITGLQALTRRCRVTVVTDSHYVTTILNGNGRAKANLDLVAQLRQVADQHDVTVQHVNGHSGHGLNERCDQLATAAAKSQRERCAGCQVVNFKTYGSVAALDQAFGKRWLYIGRTNPYAGLAQSPLANPFKVKEYGRGQTIPHYRQWLWERIQAGDEAVLNALRMIGEDTVLVCYCKPGPCHGGVVKAAAAWLKQQAG